MLEMKWLGIHALGIVIDLDDLEYHFLKLSTFLNDICMCLKSKWNDDAKHLGCPDHPAHTQEILEYILLEELFFEYEFREIWLNACLEDLIGNDSEVLLINSSVDDEFEFDKISIM